MLNSFFQGFKVPVKLYWEASYTKIIETQHTLTNLNTDHWLHYTVFRWYWWFLLFWTISPLFIWWKYTDRNRFLEVSFFGLLVSLSSGILDALGVSVGYWCYPFALLPFLPNFFPIDYVVVPVVFMLIYQKYPTWKGFLIGSTIISAVLSLVLDPVIVWINLYQPLKWQYIYSVPTFVFMVSFCRLVTMFLIRQDRRYRGPCHGE